MNHFELINAILLELNFKQVEEFDVLVKYDHLKTKTLLNRINKEICLFVPWKFRERTTNILISTDINEVNNTIKGRITHIVIDKEAYSYTHNYEAFYRQENLKNVYSMRGNKILFPEFSEEKTATIFYLTDNFAIDEDNNDKVDLKLETDKSIIPEHFLERILVYGTCMRFHGLLNHPKYRHWLTEYTLALKDLKKLENSYDMPEM